MDSEDLFGGFNFEEAMSQDYISEANQSKPTDQVVNTESDTLFEELNEFDTNDAIVEDEAEQTDKDVIDDTSEETPSEQNNTSSSPLSAFAKLLHDEGVLSDFEKEPEDVNGLIDLIRSEINNNAEAYINALPEDLKAAINNYRAGVPLDKVIELSSKKTEINNITSDELSENEDLQRSLVEDLYKSKGLSTAKINKLIEKFEATGSLADEANDALAEIKESYKQAEINAREQAAKQKELAAENNRKQLESIKAELESTEEIIPGLKLNKNIRDKVYESMTTPIEKDGQIMSKIALTRSKNPVAFEKVIHYFHELGWLNFNDKGEYNPDFSAIKKVGKTAAIKEFDTALAKSKLGVEGKSRTVIDDAGEEPDINVLKNIFNKL